MNKIKAFLKSKFFTSFIAGALCNLAFAPIHFFPAAIISISAFYFLLENEGQKKRIFWLSWFYGFGYFLAGVYWIAIALLVDASQFAWLIPFAVTLIPGVLAIYLALFALSYKALIKKFNFSATYQKAIIFAIFWLIFEILRAFLFTGFPWNLLGYIWSFSDSLSQIANIFGIWGLSLFSVFICLIPTSFFKFENRKISIKKSNFSDKVFGTTLFFFFILSLFYGHYCIDESKIMAEEDKKLRLVQGNIQQDMKWDAQQKYRNFLKHIKLTNSQDLNAVKIVIWSETAVPYAIDGNPELLDNLKLATPSDGALITGAVRVKYSSSDEVEGVWNSVFAVGDSGVIDYYDKHHLVPFGEYIPLQKYLPFVSKITDGAIGFSEGDGAKTVKTNSLSFSPLLCYEVIFSDKIIDKKDRPDLLVNLTNDAWFGKSSGPYQHFDMAKMRAVEYGISLARVANTGITAFFDPFGRVVKKIDLNEEGFIDVSFIKSLEPTIYSKYGFYPLILLILTLLVFLIHKPKN